MKKRAIKLSDPRALRVLAHPTRVELLALLRREGPLTATEAAERFGESPSSCSYHLRQLAEYGLIEDTGSGRGRERPWRVTAISVEWEGIGNRQPSGVAAAMLSRVILERHFESAVDWIERQPEERREWAEAALIADLAVYMTLEELREVEANFRSLVEPFLQRLEAEEPPAPGARPVSLVTLAFPLAEEPG